MRSWFSVLDRGEKVVVVVTGLAILGAVAFTLVPFSTDDGLPCGAPIVEWLGGPSGAGVPSDLDPGTVAPCQAPGRRRMLASLVWLVLAPVAGWVGLGLVREHGA